MLIELRPSTRQKLTHTVNDTDAFFAIKDALTLDKKDKKDATVAKQPPMVYTRRKYIDNVPENRRRWCEDEEIFPIGAKDWDADRQRWLWNEDNDDGFQTAEDHIQWGIVDGGHRWIAVKVSTIALLFVKLHM